MAKQGENSASMPTANLGIKDGLQFKCTGCGDCCTGAPGYVWVNKAKRSRRWPRSWGLEIGRVRAEVRPQGRRAQEPQRIQKWRLRVLRRRDAEVHGLQVRPRQCRTWPFWDSNLRTPETWAETCRVAPAAARGGLYQLEEIQEQASVIHV